MTNTAKSESLNEIKKFFQNKKTQNILAITLFLLTIFVGVSLRVQPIVQGNLIDETTGDYTPLALDPYYFLRVSETKLETGNDLPKFDSMRSPVFDRPWLKEILPDSTIIIYKVMHTFNSDVTLNYANVLNPVIFFVLGLIAFALLCYFLTKNKWLPVIASGLLAIIPPYLYRTLAGFSDHESIGMFGFFLALIFFYLGMKLMEKKKQPEKKIVLWGILAGMSTMFAIASWGGGAAFLFMILPLSYLVRWFTKKDKPMWHYILFYSIWIVSFLVFGAILGFDLSALTKRYMTSATGILTLIAIGYTLIETIILKYKNTPKTIKKYSQISSFVGVIIFGGIFYQAFIGNVFSMVADLVQRILYPFGTGRVTLTVAENAQPYLNSFISQIGTSLFYIFLVGCFIIGGKVAHGIKEKKYRRVFTATYAFFISGILFSRVSQDALFNGENFISKAFFFISFLTFFISTIYIYQKSEWKISLRWIFIASWMIPMLLSMRSAVRVFFTITPFVVMIAAFAIFEVFNWAKKNKDDFLKMAGYLLVIASIILLVIASFSYHASSQYQAKNQAPSYDSTWQKAMGWVRNNTAEDSVFLHWWDYGYWVQTGGDRTTIVDGGYHPDFLVHNIGRYVLTTPYPETAKSYMKTFGANYLLIDPTDIGKYSAYSSIGTDKEVDDRTSWLVTLTSKPSEIQETRNGTTKTYRGGTMLDEDIVYEKDGEKIFLPKGKAGLGALIVQEMKAGIKQPVGIYVYNNNQYELPIRYVYTKGELFDFGKGINATVYLYPSVSSSSAGQSVDETGAAMYLSAKVKDSLVAQLYLMNDPNNLYPELELVHEQSDYPFNFYYGGYRGALKIYKINLENMTNILQREEFLEEWQSNDEEMYGALDDLQFSTN